MSSTPPEDPEQHAIEVASEWSDVAEVFVRTRMRELGIPEPQIGTTDIQGGGVRRAFIAHESDGGSCDTAGRINVDGGILNPDLHVQGVGPAASEAWAHARLRDRIDAVIAHEEAESRAGTHAGAEAQAGDTALPISSAARDLLRLIARHA